MDLTQIFIVLVLAIIGIGIGFFIGQKAAVRMNATLLEEAKTEAQQIKENKISEAETNQKQIFSEAETQAQHMRREANKYATQHKKKIDDIERKLKQKENTFITQMFDKTGVRLSGGEVQRMMLARALYKDPEILVLDEATSALDEETEKKVMSYIYNLKQSMTIIIIAYRTSTLDHCSDTIELSNGQII